MSTDNGSGQDRRPAEERAEELMERLTSEGARTLGRLVGRAREELEDIIAEARSVHERWREPGGD